MYWCNIMDTTFYVLKLSERSLCLIVFLGLAMVGLLGLQTSVAAKEETEKSSVLASESLRGVYYGTGGQDVQQNKVGKLAIELLKNTEKTTVRVDHPFRTGDKFRFTISSNRDGWLYILHRSASEDLRLLWPRLAPDNEEEYLDMNQIKARQIKTVPPAPGLFIFDAEVGDEYFYAVVADERKVPQFSAKGVARSEVVAASDDSGQRKRIVNFGVRGGTKTTSTPLRGVIYDPGSEDTDPYLYFASPAGEDSQQVFVEFQLRHEE